MLYATASQTVGPYLHIGLTWLNTDTLYREGAKGERISIEGQLVDASGMPISDGMIELWQADANGRYPHPEDARKDADPFFQGFGRQPTDAQGLFRFHTVKPGRVPGPDGYLQAPHILVSVFGRGIIRRMATRIYFPGEASNAEDPVLACVPEARRSTLIAQPLDGGPGRYRFNIVVQGAWLGQGETVFFDL